MAGRLNSGLAILVVAGLTLAAVGGMGFVAPRTVARFERLKETGTVGPVALWAGERYTVLVEAEGGSLFEYGLAQVAVREEATGMIVAKATEELAGPSPTRLPPFGRALTQVLEFEAPTSGNYSFEYRVIEPQASSAPALVVARPFLSLDAARALFASSVFAAAFGLAGALGLDGRHVAPNARARHRSGSARGHR